MTDIFIVDAARTPMGRLGGQLAHVRPDDLAAHAIRGIMARQPHLDPKGIEDVVWGASNQAGEDNRNVGRMAVLLAGLPLEVTGMTVNRLCGSGLQAVTTAAHALSDGWGDVMIAGGSESMSRAPYAMLKAAKGFGVGTPEIVDTVLGWRLVNPHMQRDYPPIGLGVTAERVAERYGVDRESQDEFALASHLNAAAAQASGRFTAELLPIEAAQDPRGRQIATIEQDEGVRPDSSMETLSKLAAAFVPDGTVTAGNSSPMNDGAAALLLATQAGIERHDLTPMARIVATGAAGVHPDYMGIGPVPATAKALTRAGIAMADMNLIELNEAFAAQAVACRRELDMDPGIVNVNGGAIAIGHPLGASGARILTTLVHELEKRQARYGLATMCIGVGQGISMIVERV